MISAVVDVPAAPPALAAGRGRLASTPSSPDTSVKASGIETQPGVPPLEKAIQDSDDGVVPNTAQLGITSTADPAVNHSLISQSSISRPQPVLEKVNPAAALEAIVAAQASLKSLPKLGPRSTIIPVPQFQDGKCQQTTRSLDTVLNWTETPADAYRLAGEAEKLVFLIHVSGNFEIPGFT